MAAVTGEEADPATVRVVWERAAGNPLFAEEIAAAGAGRIPDQLSELVVARVDALPD